MTYLLENWLPLVCLLAAAALCAPAAWHWRRHGSWPWGYCLAAAILASYGTGSFEMFPWSWVGPTLAITALTTFIFLLVLVILTGYWSAPLGYALTCLFFFGLGDFSAAAVAESLRIAGLFLFSLRVQEPWWLLLLVLIPVLLWTSYANLITLGPGRRWIVLGLRCALIALLALAVSEAYARKPNDNVTVIFVWDRSLSMPPDFVNGRD